MVVSINCLRPSSTYEVYIEGEMTTSRLEERVTRRDRCCFGGVSQGGGLCLVFLDSLQLPAM